VSARPRPGPEPSDPFGLFAKPEGGLPTPAMPTMDELLRQMLFKLQDLGGSESNGMPGMSRQGVAMPAPTVPAWRPRSATGYRIPIIPPRERRVPTFSKMAGEMPRPTATSGMGAIGTELPASYDLVGPFVPILKVEEPRSFSPERIAGAAGRAVTALFETPLGFSDETLGPLINQAPEDYGGARGVASLVRTFNEVLIQGGSQGLDAAQRAALAPVAGGIAAVRQTAEELGMSTTWARRLERDLNDLTVTLGISAGQSYGGTPRVPSGYRVITEADARGGLDRAVLQLPPQVRPGARKALREAFDAGEKAAIEAAEARQAGERPPAIDEPVQAERPSWHSANIAVGSKDRNTGAPVMQPSKDRRVLLREATKAQPAFEASLKEIADRIPGTFVEGPRVKADNPRLDQKTQRYHRDLERLGKSATGPDDGAHLIEDYLAGRLVVDNQEVLDRIVSAVESRFDVIRKRDNMVYPLRASGYTSLYYQVKLPNGMTAELQVQPRPIWEAAKKQRASYEYVRIFENKRMAHGERMKMNEVMRKSRSLFDIAWREWVRSGGEDVREKR
jgi:hypothetical protein